MNLDKAELDRRHLLRLAGVRDKKVYIGPESVDLQINNTCNLRCKYCWTHAPGNSAHFDKPNQFSWKMFTEIVDDCVDLQVNEIVLIGSGEPTLHPKFREMMRYLEDKPIRVKVISNATFPLEHCLDVIRGDQIAVDLSAIDRERYHDLQGKDLFDRVVGNIKKLVALRDSVKPSFFVEIAFIVNSENVGQAEEMKKFSKELGVDLLFFKKMNIHAFNRQISLPEDPTTLISGEDRVTPPECLHGWFYFTFKPEGSASICCRIPQMPLGNLNKMSFKELWLSPHMMNVRLLGKHGQIQKMYKACQTCPYYEKNVKRMRAAAALGAHEKALD